MTQASSSGWDGCHHHPHVTADKQSMAERPFPMCGWDRGSQDSASKDEHLIKIPSLPGGAGSLRLPFSSALGQTDRLLSFFTPYYPPYMVAEQGGLSLLRSCGARLKIGQRGGLDEGLVTSPAFGNKRKWILFAHTEENVSSLHTSWPCQAPGRHGSTSALTSGMAGSISALSPGTPEYRGHRRDLRASREWNSLPRCPHPHPLNPERN